MSLNFCDLIVLGGDLSGIIAGAMLAKRGLSVTVLDDEEPLIPQPNVITMLDSKLFKSILGKLAIPEPQLENILKNDISFQVILPEHRIDISPDPTLVFKELHREFASHASQLEMFYEEIHRLKSQELEPLLHFLPVSDRKDKKQFLKKIKLLADERVSTLLKGLPPEVTSYIQAQLHFLGSNSMLSPILLQALFLLPLSGCTTFRIVGGITELKRILFDKIDQFGGTVQSGIDTFEFLAEKGGIKGVKIPKLDFVTRCRYLISNTNIPKTYKLLPRVFWKRKLYHQVSSHPLSAIRYTVKYLTHKNVLPEMIAENCLVIREPNKPLLGTNYLQINVDTLEKPTSGSEDTIISASYLLPPEDFDKPVSHFEELHNEITGAVKNLIPFSDTCLERIFPVLHKGQDDILPDSAEDYAIFKKAASSNPTYKASLFFPTPMSPYPNLFTAGPDLLNWLGTDGKILTAQKIVDLIWKKELKLRKI